MQFGDTAECNSALLPSVAYLAAFSVFLDSMNLAHALDEQDTQDPRPTLSAKMYEVYDRLSLPFARHAAMVAV